MNKDSSKMLMVFLATVALVYGLPRLGFPSLLMQGIFLLLLAYINRDTDDLFWLVWYFVVIDAPGRLFTGGYQSTVYGLPGYRLAPGLTLSSHDLFLLLFIVKTFRKRQQFWYMFKREVWLLIGLGIFYLVLSLALGTSSQNLIRAFRSVIYWLWPLVVARVITKPEDMERVFRMLLPIVVICFLLIIHTYVTGNYLHNILSGISRFRSLEASDESFARALFSSSIVGISLILSVYLLFRQATSIKQNILILGALLSGISIFLSGTRGWMLFLLLVLSSFFFMRGFGFIKQMIRILVIVSLVFLLIYTLFPMVFTQGLLAYDRLLTLEAFAEGDLTAGGTLSRVNFRGPRAMAVWRESPIIGWAFSNTFVEHFDPHVGNQTNLMNLGVLGFIVLNLAYLSILAKTWRQGRLRKMFHAGDNSYWVLILALVGFFVVHSTSTILWSLALTNASLYLIWAFLFALINIALRPGTNNDRRI